MEVQVLSAAPRTLADRRVGPIYRGAQTWCHAAVAELVDALASGASSRKGVEVRVLSAAPTSLRVFPVSREHPNLSRSVRALAARRAAVSDDDLVVSLPTSAGKTRIAELAALTTLAMDKRVVIVTPLRALSAQTERSFRSAFAPLGTTVSSLYGKSGLSAGDFDALRSHQIVVSTPEKLDFALRSDPDVIADIGLIVLDEGHMIGPGDREIRFEILVQRLLRRADAAERRIVCLSAILPKGDGLNDTTAWIRFDAEGEAVRSEWRPTRQRYGTLEWRGAAATLHHDLDHNGPFVSQFIDQISGPEPDVQRSVATLHHCSHRQPGVLAALAAAQDARAVFKVERLSRRAAVRAGKAVSPAGFLQVGGAGRIIGEKSLELG